VPISPTNLSNIVLSAGTTTTAPIKLAAGTNLTTPAAGALEYNGTSYFATGNTSQGRGVIPVSQYYYLPTTQNSVSNTISVFPASNITLDPGFYRYEAEIYMVIGYNATYISFRFGYGTAPNISQFNGFFMGSGSGGLNTTTSMSTAGVANQSGSSYSSYIPLPSTIVLTAYRYYGFKIIANWVVNTTTTFDFQLTTTGSQQIIDIINGTCATLTKLPTSSVGTFS
jgi:hypothetical protein